MFLKFLAYGVGGLLGIKALSQGHDYVTRTKGMKAQIGDTVFVNSSKSLRPVGINANDDQTRLFGFGDVPFSTIPITVTAVHPDTPGSRGNHDISGVLRIPEVLSQNTTGIEVQFNSQNVARVTRQGIEIQDGPHPLF